MTGGGGGGGTAAGCNNYTQVVICKFSHKPGDFDLHWRLLRYRGKRRFFFRVRARVFVCVLD